jgi:hypothetical protein
MKKREKQKWLRERNIRDVVDQERGQGCESLFWKFIFHIQRLRESVRVGKERTKFHLSRKKNTPGFMT